LSEQQVLVPDIGDFTDVDVIEVHVNAGDVVAVEDALITLETDKAAMEVPAPTGGEVSSVAVAVGDKVSEGSLILTLEVGAESAPPPPDKTEPHREIETAAAITVGPFMREVTVPDIGEFSDVDVIQVFVKPGDRIAVDDPLVTLETDKAAMDVPSPYDGTVTAVNLKPGDKVSESDLILMLESAEAVPARLPVEDDDAPTRRQPAPPTAPPQAPAARVEPATKPPTSPVQPPIDEKTFAKAHASPAVRKFARELGVDLGRVKGSGRKGRIVQDDVKAYVKSFIKGDEQTPGAGLPKVPKVDFEKFGPVKIQALSRIKKISGVRLQASWINLPHVTQHDEADITELEQARQQLKAKAAGEGIRLTPLAFVLKACIQALQKFPQFNSSLDEGGQNLILKQYFHLGFAADTPQGLVVPVIRDADRKDIYELARELGELSEKAREGKLKVDQMQGGTFTVSSLGGIGGTAFTPIINAPEVAILGVSRSKTVPVYQDGELVPRLLVPLSLSYDHRVIDGAEAVKFTTYLGEALADVKSLLEAIP